MADTAALILSVAQALLKADAAVAALVGDRVFGAVPQRPTYPYVRLSCTSEPWSTQTTTGMNHTLRVQAFSQDGKPGVPLAIRAACYAALNRKEVELSEEAVLIEHDGLADCFPEEDGKTYQAVIEFSILI